MGRLGISAQVLTFIFLFVLIIIIYFPPTLDFSTLNPFWNGYSKIVNEFNSSIIYKDLVVNIPSRPPQVALMIIPYEPYSPDELKSIDYFVKSGGLLIILDDYGYGNEILTYMRAPVTIWNSGILIDPLFNYKNGKLPKIRDFAWQKAIKGGIKELILNHASILNITGNAEVLAWSSQLSFFDLNSNYVLDKGEPEGPLPVVARFKLGNGLVYVISDPSIFINSMIKLGDNLEFLKIIVGDRELIIDQSHLRKNVHLNLKERLVIIFKDLSKPEHLSYMILTILIIQSFIIKKWLSS